MWLRVSFFCWLKCVCSFSSRVSSWTGYTHLFWHSHHLGLNMWSPLPHVSSMLLWKQSLFSVLFWCAETANFTNIFLTQLLSSSPSMKFMQPFKVRMARTNYHSIPEEISAVPCSVVFNQSVQEAPYLVCPGITNVFFMTASHWWATVIHHQIMPQVLLFLCFLSSWWVSTL